MGQCLGWIGSDPSTHWLRLTQWVMGCTDPHQDALIQWVHWVNEWARYEQVSESVGNDWAEWVG